MSRDKKITWKVAENDTGGLTLYVYDNDQLIWAHAGGHHNPPELRADIAALKDGDHPLHDAWGGNDLIDEDIVRDVRSDYGNIAIDDSDIYDAEGHIIPLSADEYYNPDDAIIADSESGPLPYDEVVSPWARRVFYPQNGD